MLSTLELMQRVPLLSLLTEAQALRVAQSAVKRRIRRGGLVVQQGTDSAGLFVLLAGQARVLRADARGREFTFSYLKPGDYFGELSMLDQQPHSETVRAEVDLDILVVDRAELSACLPEPGSATFALLSVLVQRLRHANRQIEALALLDVRGRVEQVLLDRSEMHNGRRLVRHKLSRQALAGSVGSTREMVSRVMSCLEEEGLIQTLESGALVLSGRLAQGVAAHRQQLAPALSMGSAQNLRRPLREPRTPHEQDPKRQQGSQETQAGARHEAGGAGAGHSGRGAAPAAEEVIRPRHAPPTRE